MHSDRRADETRRHISLLPNGTKFGYNTPQGTAYGSVGSCDEGGWIYPDWTFRPPGSYLPGWLRSTQVFKVEAYPSAITG